ncbi:MAG: hypothetical protein WCP22_00890 [Chlamydiota bacterium]
MKIFGGHSLQRYCGIAFLVLLCGCSTFTWRHRASRHATSITESRAISIAKHAIRKRNPEVQEIRSRARFKDSQWIVSANFTTLDDWFGLFIEEGHCSVVVDTSGKVLAYHSGA